MFDKDFFRFALGLGAIILASLGILYITGHFQEKGESAQTATVR
ncbi:MAG TPA: hypothetical protein VHE10_01325 [Candidatus Paceibacterota bacterium]|nr:hypothetical protein [Candidatus Paceibacterota bacterium]